MKKVVLLTILLLSALPSYATIYCHGTLKNQSISQDIKIKKNCTLENLIIHGDVILENGAVASLTNNHIKGSILASAKFRTFNATDNNVKGHVRLNQGNNIHLKTNTIYGNLHVQNSTGIVNIYANQVQGNLMCNSNAFTINGAKNNVSGNKQQQCQTF